MNGNLNIISKKGNKEAKFLIVDNKLNWEIKGKNIGSIDLKKGFTAIEKNGDNSFTVGPTVDGEYLELGAANKEESEKWFEELTNLITPNEKDEQDDMENIDTATKEGWLLVVGKKQPTNRYCELREGTFRWFSSSDKGSKSFKSELYLYGCEVSSKEKQITIKPTTGDKKPLELSTNLKTETSSWLNSIQEEIEIAKEMGAVVEGDKKKAGLAARMKKGIGQKIATSKGAKKVLNKEALDLLDALHKVVEAYSGIKKADEIEQSLIRILTKMYFAISNKQVLTSEFLKADKPLRDAFKIVSLIWGGRLNKVQKGDDPKTVIKEAFASVQKNWKEVESVIVKALNPIVKPKNIELIRATLTYLRDPEFIKFVAKNDQIEDARLELEMAMDSYCAVEIDPKTFDD